MDTLKNVSLAAKKLKYAQSNLSTRMKQLEEQLGVKLFVRQAHGVVLTEQGEFFLHYAQKILKEVEEARSAVRLGQVTKGALYGISCCILCTQTASSVSCRAP